MLIIKRAVLILLLTLPMLVCAQTAAGPQKEEKKKDLSNRADDVRNPFESIKLEGVDEMDKLLDEAYEKTQTYQEIQYDGSEADKARAKLEYQRSVQQLDTQMEKALKTISRKWKMEEIKIEDYSKYQGIEVTEEDIKKQQEKVKKAESAMQKAQQNNQLSETEKRKAQAEYEAEKAKLDVMKSDILTEGRAPSSLSKAFEKMQKTGNEELDRRAKNVNAKAEAAKKACDGVNGNSTLEARNNCRLKRDEYDLARQAYFSLQQSQESSKKNIPSDTAIKLGLSKICNPNAGPTCHGEDTTYDFPNMMISLATQECRMERAKRIRRVKLDSGCRNTGYGKNSNFKAANGANMPCRPESFLALTRKFRFKPRFGSLFPNPITCRFPK